jgi:rhodanese-related sulfurtransferase
MSIPTIRPRQLDELRAAGQAVDLIDVRTALEYREIHAAYARNVPLDRLDAKAIQGTLGTATDRPLYVICRSGSRGQTAFEKLRAAGVHVVNVEGGTLAWEECGLPVVRGKKALSLERQVRIAIGLLVLVGVLLGWLVHPACAGLAAVMGAGLVYSGVLDTCPLGMFLARMPWNRAGESTGCCPRQVGPKGGSTGCRNRQDGSPGQ